MISITPSEARYLVGFLSEVLSQVDHKPERLVDIIAVLESQLGAAS